MTDPSWAMAFRRVRRIVTDCCKIVTSIAGAVICCLIAWAIWMMINAAMERIATH